MNTRLHRSWYIVVPLHDEVQGMGRNDYPPRLSWQQYRSCSERGTAQEKLPVPKMAQIPILDSNQISGSPRWHRKKAIVKKLISKGLAVWVIKNELARMVAIEEIRAQLLAAKVLATPWEPVEIPGLHFQPPAIKHNPEAVMVRQLKTANR